jgi:hypothetical protein
VPKVTAVQTKLNFMPGRIRMCARHSCTSPLKNDHRGFLGSVDAPQCSIVQEMDHLDFARVAACLVEAGLAGKPETDLMRAFLL